MIRPARDDDQRDVEAIVQAAYAPYVSRMGRKPMPMLDDYAALIRQGRIFVVVMAEGVIAGLVDLVLEPEAMLLNNIAVRPDLTGQGYGAQLMRFAERSTREAGRPVLRLFTNITMTENIALYSRVGFVETGREMIGERHRVNMAKRLD